MSANVGSSPRRVENLCVGGGYESAPDGGVSLDSAGNIDADGEGPLAASVVELLDQMSSMNDILHRQLDTATATLQQQAGEITSYLSEARTDSLTDLPNRRALDEELAKRFTQRKHRPRPLSLILIAGIL